MRLPLFLVTLLFLYNLSFAQMGDLFLTHHTLDIEGLDNLNFEIVSNSKGQLCIANRSGVLFYDGHHWDFIATPSSALSIAFDADDNIYVGCVGDFGKIGFKDNKFQFLSLNSNKGDYGLYTKTLIKDSSVYFLSENNLNRYHITHHKSHVLFPKNEQDYFKNMFEVDNKVLIQTNDTVMLYDPGDSLVYQNWDAPDSAEFIFFDKHPTQDKYLVGTDDNRTYIYRDSKFHECKISDFLEEHESFVNNGKWVNDRYFALSTLEDGCILYDNKKSTIVEVINQSKGLPDNQIFAIGSDKEDGLWISHNYGISRMEVSIPFRSFTNFQGLEGNISEAFFYKRQLFVATSEGVYYLDKEDIFKSTVYYVEKKTRAKKVSAVEKKEEVQTEPKPEPETNRKKKWWKRIIKKSDDTGANESEKLGRSKSTSVPQKLNKSNKKRYEKRIRKELLFSEFVFKPVEGIHSKAEKFVVYKDKLLVAGTNGVYSIEEGKGQLIIHEPVRLIEKERKSDRLIICTYFDEIKLYELDEDFWILSDQIDLHGNVVLNALNDVSGRTWFVTAGSLYEFNNLSSENPDYNVYEFNNPFIDKAKLAYVDKQLYLVNNQGYFYLNTTLKKIVEDTTLIQEIGRPIKHLQQRNGLIWIYNGENWVRINRDKSTTKNSLFRLFPNMNYVSEYGNMLWLVNESNEILQYDEALNDSLISKNKMFFRKVTNNNGDVLLSKNMSFSHDENTIHFELSRPDYRGILKAEYQYRLRGPNSSGWSKWSGKSNIDLNFLAPGSYKLDVKSKDSFGNIQESDVIKFTINPPYWQTPWFTGLQIGFMILLVLGSILMNRRAKTKHVIVTEALTIITIVLVIEFLQTAAGNYLNIKSSPVVDFGIDVCIALLIFPLEQLLKKYMKANNTGPGLAGKGIIDVVKELFSKKPKTA